MYISRRFVVAVVPVLALAGAASAQARLQSTDFLRLRAVGAVQWSPDGTRIVYTVTSNDGPGGPYSSCGFSPFARDGHGPLRCHPLPALDSADVADVLAAVTPGVHRLLRRQGCDPSEGVPGADAFGETTAWREGPPPAACHARWEGFDLHAAVRVPAGQRAAGTRMPLGTAASGGGGAAPRGG